MQNKLLKLKNNKNEIIFISFLINDYYKENNILLNIESYFHYLNNEIILFTIKINKNSYNIYEKILNSFSINQFLNIKDDYFILEDLNKNNIKIKLIHSDFFDKKYNEYFGNVNFNKILNREFINVNYYFKLI